MKKFYTLILSFIALGAAAQTTFYTESFEGTTGYRFPNGSGVGSSTQDFFDRTDLAGAPAQEIFTYGGFDGSFFIAGEDIDGAIGVSQGVVYLDNIDISGRTNLQFTAAFASGTDIDIDEAADSISVEVKIDNGSWTVIGRFRADSATTSSTGFNGQFGEDTNNDGFGDGSNLTGTFTDFSWPIVGSGDSLDIRITMDLGAGDEEAAFDNIRVSGMGGTSPNYTLQILHASDLEGGVEAVERAKFFAALVDTMEGAYANSITLSAGDNYIPGPFYNAAGDQAIFRDGGVFNRTYNTLFGTTGYNSLREGNGRADISIMNIIGFDASAIGNHEFDAGADAMESIIEEDFRSPIGPDGDRWVGAQFPYLGANLDFSASSDLGNLFEGTIQENTSFQSGVVASTAGNSSISKVAAATYISRGGEKIGVVGVTTPRLSSISSPGDVAVTGPTIDDMPQLALEVQPWIDSLTQNQGINKIILVTHLQQLVLEEQLIGLLSGVDVIIAGGSDAILANANDRLAAGDVAVRPYPVLLPNLDGDTAAIVSTNGEYSYVGRLVIDFDMNGKLITSSISDLISGPYIADTMMVASEWGTANAFGDPAGKGALVDSITSAVRGIVVSKDGNIFGKTDVYLNGERTFVRSEETNFGNLSADANLWQAQQVDPTVSVSIKNGGGIRAAIGEIRETSPGVFEQLPPQANPASGKQTGEVSQLDIENSLRFNNNLTLLDASAAELKALIEHGVSDWAVGSTEGKFGQVGGIRFSFDPSQTAGSRVQSLVIVDDNGVYQDTIVQNGTIYGNASRIIRIVTLGFLAGGGDGYPFPATNRVDLDTLSTLAAGTATFATAGTEQDALAEYMVNEYASTPFNDSDRVATADSRIENISLRSDDIFLPFASFDEERVSVLEDAGNVSIQVNYNNPTSSAIPVGFRALGISTTDASDYTLGTGTMLANTNGSFNLTMTVNDDNATESDEIVFLEIVNDSSSYKVNADDRGYFLAFIKDNENVGPSATKAINIDTIASYQGLSGVSGTEIIDYDSASQRLFVTSPSSVEILDFSDPTNISNLSSITFGANDEVNSLAVYNSVIAVAIADIATATAGRVAFYDTLGTLISSVTVGVLPDMVTFTPDGQKVITANEGEPSDDYLTDPLGSISIIDVSGGFAALTNANVTTLDFTAFNSQRASLEAAGVRLFGPGASVAQDMEPEYVAISSDNSRAFVACQENNAIVVVDLTNNSILSVEALGTKDHSLPGNGFDTDRRADSIHIANGPFQGFYMPDAIATYEVSGTRYIVTANEGDSRDYSGYSEEERLDDLTLDPTAFPNADEINDAYGDVKVTSANGDTDNDGDYDEIYTYGARSFSIFDENGTLVYDSGDDFERIIQNSSIYSTLFNVADDGNTIKNRSDDKGPEPEAVVLGEINGQTYAFIGMERTGGMMVYDITNPAAPIFVDVNIPRDPITGAGDQAPEGFIFIDSASSPLGFPMVLAANEESNTISIWTINDTRVSLNEVAGNNSKLLVYPNPSNNQVFVTAENEIIQQVEVLDVQGKLVRNILKPGKVQVINVNDLEPNVYLLRITTENGISTSKVIVQ